jgi:hypothetical protein
MPSSSGHSSSPGPTSLQAGGHLTPTSYSSNSRLIRRCYAMTYNNGCSSTSHSSTRGDHLTAASDSDWSVCPQTLSRLSTHFCNWLGCFLTPQIWPLHGPNRKCCSFDMCDVVSCVAF